MFNKIILSQIAWIFILLIIFIIVLNGFRYNTFKKSLELANNSDFGFYKSISLKMYSVITTEYKNFLAQDIKKNIEENTNKFLSVKSVSVPIIMYHHIHPDFISSKDAILAGLTVSPAKFEQDLIAIRDSGYTTIFPQEIFDIFNGKLDPNKKFIVLTIDDGYLDNYTYGFDLLKKYQMKAIIYLIGNRMGRSMEGNDYFSWEKAIEMKNSGYVTFGSHTMDHSDLSKLGEEDLRYQIVESKKIIEENLQMSILDFCYPYGKYSEKAVKIVEEAGYNNATTTVSGMGRTIENRFLWPRSRGMQKYSIGGFLK